MRSQQFSVASATTLLSASLLLASIADTSVLAFVSPNVMPTTSQSSTTCLFSGRSPTGSSSYAAFGDGQAHSSSSHGRRSSEFHDLQPIEKSDERRLRMQQDEHTKARFAAFGDELWDLRSKMTELSVDLISSMASGDRDTEQNVRDELRDAEGRDPELVYELELAALSEAESEGKASKAQAHREEASAARSVLPHFNLEGLWVGKYGENGYEMINVTYSGDLLTAYKVTGDNNVPRGEITFQADLSPLKTTRGGKPKQSLQPIKLTESAAKKWGTSQLPRYSGSGSVAEEGFINQQWMDGQLIMIGDSYFSFAWLPISHQIFFGRPSPELALKMLREAGNSEVMGIGTPPPSVEDDDVGKMRAYITRCLDETDAHFEDEVLEGKSNEFSCIWHNEATEECYFE